MAIQTNLKSLTPRREAFKREITLLSGAFYNRQAFPDGKITVYPWDSAVDAWFQERLRQPKRENALWEAVEKVAYMNGATYQQMPVGDIMTIVMVSRSIRSDCVIEYSSVCPNCQYKMTDKVTVPGELAKVGEKKADWPGFDTITLPESNDIVCLRVLSVKDETVIAERSDDDKKRVPDAIASLLMAIISVGGGKPESQDEILTWYLALSPKDVDYLTKQRAQLTPQLDQDLDIECDKCHEQYKHTLDLGRDFFRVA